MNDVALSRVPRQAQLAKSGGRGLYRQNIFAVTRVPTAATGRRVLAERNRARTRLEVQADWPPDSRAPFTAPYRREEVLAAFDGLKDPLLRIIHEALWLWSAPDAECRCPAGVHEAHDAAVLGHAAVLEAAADASSASPESSESPESPASLTSLTGRRSGWVRAASAWANLLNGDALWEHLRRRVRALDDPRLREDWEAELRSLLPALLISPLVELATSRRDLRNILVEQSGDWNALSPNGNEVQRAYERALEPAFTALSDQVKSAHHTLAAGRPAVAAAALVDVVLPALRDLEDFESQVPPGRLAIVVDQVVLALNNAAVAVDRAPERKTGHQERTDLSPCTLLEKAVEITGDHNLGLLQNNLRAFRRRSLRIGSTASDDVALKVKQTGSGCLLSWLTLFTLIGTWLGLGLTVVPALTTWWGWTLGAVATYLLLGASARRAVAFSQAAEAAGLESRR